MSSPNSLKSNITSFLLMLYILPGSFFVVKYNFEYANENGFFSWLFLGEVVATAKATIWPYYVFFDQDSQHPALEDMSEKEKKNVMHLKSSLEYNNKGTNTTNKEGDVYPSDLKTSQYFEEALEYHKKALSEAKKIRKEDFPDFDRKDEFFNRYRNEFIKSQKLYITGHKEKDMKIIRKSFELNQKFGDFYRTLDYFKK